MDEEVEAVNASIATSASDGIQRASIGSESVDAMRVDDQIKAANHLAAVGAAQQPHFGLRFSKLIPPGCG